MFRSETAGVASRCGCIGDEDGVPITSLMERPLAKQFLVRPEQVARVLTKKQLGKPASGYPLKDEQSAARRTT